MKVYARYFEENGLAYRRDTILQFGTSWNLIGSVILINPGSSAPLNSIISEEEMSNLFNITLTDNPEEWKIFSIDPTMRYIEKLFAGKYINKDKTLDGYIQLFNLFNLRNANLGEALSLYKSNQNQNPNISSILNDIKRLGDKPTYLGWGGEGKNNKLLLKYSQSVFNEIKPPYLDSDFSKNTFYHPRYLQMSFKSSGKTINLLHHFYDQSRGYVWDGISVKVLNPINSQQVFNLFKERSLKQDFQKLIKEIKLENKTIRFFFDDGDNNQMELIVTASQKGYMGIRYRHNYPIVKENSIKYIQQGQSLGYQTNIHTGGKWICLQNFDELGVHENEVVDCLIDGCKLFIETVK